MYIYIYIYIYILIISPFNKDILCLPKCILLIKVANFFLITHVKFHGKYMFRYGDISENMSIYGNPYLICTVKYRRLWNTKLLVKSKLLNRFHWNLKLMRIWWWSLTWNKKTKLGKIGPSPLIALIKSKTKNFHLV